MRDFAVTKCVPMVLRAVFGEIRPEGICALVVGSVATGTCSTGSDVDIAVVCNADMYSRLELRSFWESGRPSQLTVDGVPVHYYGISIENIERKLRNLNDEYLNTYSTAIVAHDPSPIWSQLRHLLAPNPAVRAARVQGKLDMLERRSRVLDACFADQDPIAVAKVCLELTVLSVKVCALLDDVPFDPRKRLFSTALTGRIGTQARCDAMAMLDLLGRCALGSAEAQAQYQCAVHRIIGLLKEMTLAQGLEVSLDKPDHRHCEPQPGY